MRSNLIKNAILVGASVAFVFLITEAGLRLRGVSHPSFHVPDPEVGGILRPGAQGWQDKEGRAWVSINSDGMRDREHTVAKPPGVLRIAVLGDSFAEGLQVAQEKTFWSVMERELGACGSLGGRRPEALNFGVSGYGTASELLVLRHRVWKYQPDIVLLTFFSGNDVRNNSRELNQEPATAYFVRRDGRLVLDESFRAHAPRRGLARRLYAFLRERSRVLQVVDKARGSLRRRATAKAGVHGDMASNEASAAQGIEAGLDEAVYAPPKDPAWEEAWRITEELIVMMRDEVRARGARFVVATLSTGIQAHPDAALRKAFMARLGIDSLDYPDERIRALAERERIPLIQLAGPLRAYAESHGRALHGFSNAKPGFGHWNEEGNEVAGRLIARGLCDSLSDRAAVSTAPAR